MDTPSCRRTPGTTTRRTTIRLRGGTQTFGFDPQARIDFGYNSYDQVATAAKTIIARYYGRAPEKSYFAGCSEGGREGMMLSQRFPAQFDGILACSPGFNLPRAAVAEAWDSQAFAEVARAGQVVDANSQPHVNKAFTDEDLALVSRAVLEACDAMDGAADGLVQSFTSCTTPVVAPKLSAITCKGAKSDDVPDRRRRSTALKKVFGGARTSKGEAVYAAWAWDAGVGGKVGSAYNMGWRIWKLGPYGAPANAAINLTLGRERAPVDLRHAAGRGADGRRRSRRVRAGIRRQPVPRRARQPCRRVPAVLAGVHEGQLDRSVRHSRAGAASWSSRRASAIRCSRFSTRPRGGTR